MKKGKRGNAVDALRVIRRRFRQGLIGQGQEEVPTAKLREVLSDIDAPRDRVELVTSEKLHEWIGSEEGSRKIRSAASKIAKSLELAAHVLVFGDGREYDKKTGQWRTKSGHLIDGKSSRGMGSLQQESSAFVFWGPGQPIVNVTESKLSEEELATVLPYGPLPQGPKGEPLSWSHGLVLARALTAILRDLTEMADADLLPDLVSEALRIGIYFPSLIDAGEEDGSDWFRGIVRGFWSDHEEETYRTPSVETITHKGEDWTKIRNAATGVAWTLGGDGEELPEYALASRSVFLPNGSDILPEDARFMPMQRHLRIELEPIDGLPEVPLANAGVMGKFLDNPAACKLALLSFTELVPSSGPVLFRDLASRISPGRRLQRRDYVAIAEALRQMGRLRVYLQDEAESSFPLFACSTWHHGRPDLANAETITRFGLSDDFLSGIRSLPGKRDREAWFLLNLSKAMRFKGKDGVRLLRTYVYSAAAIGGLYNSRTKELDLVAAERRPIPIDAWGLLVNAFSPAQVEYLRAKGKGSESAKVGTKKARAALRSDLECLQEEHGLIRAEFRGGHKSELVILPTEDHLDALADRKRKAPRPI